jgi:apolipoprotein N-acyltransferase
LDQGTLGVAICYDFDAPTVATSLAQAGATVLVVPTFDRITWSRMQHVHHELLLRIRAVETDRWILRAASSGRTEVIDPHGHPSAAGVEIGGPGQVVLPFAHRNTFALGTLLSPLGPIAAAGSLLFVVWHGFMRRRLPRLQ